MILNAVHGNILENIYIRELRLMIETLIKLSMSYEIYLMSITGGSKFYKRAEPHAGVSHVYCGRFVLKADNRQIGMACDLCYTFMWGFPDKRLVRYYSSAISLIYIYFPFF